MQTAIQEDLFTKSQPPVTPMMQQYLQIKAEHQDCLLFFRMGDFYELFFEDAMSAAPILEVVLTKRGKHLENEIPMCGVPSHSYEHYVTKLLKAGFKVAVCEQLETPEQAKKRGHKAVVKREVVRIITPGTIIEEHMLDSKSSQNLISLFLNKDEIAIVCADITTGALFIQKSSATALAQDIARLAPKEIIVSEVNYAVAYIKNALDAYRKNVSVRANNLFEIKRATEKVQSYYKIMSLESLGEFTETEVRAMGALFEYISYTYKSSLPKLKTPKVINSKFFLDIDASTRKNLELTEPLNADKGKSLLDIIDETLTPMGARLLANYMNFPLTNSAAINKRLDNVDAFMQHDLLGVRSRELMRSMPDFERLLGKIYVRKSSFDDLKTLKNGLELIIALADVVRSYGAHLSDNLKIALNQMCNFNDLLDALNKAIDTDSQFSSGIKFAFSPKLDKLYELKNNSSALLDNLRDKYRAETGINTLKITYNNMLGYFIDITASHLSKVQDPKFILRQSLVSGSRFTTEELRKLETEIVECDQNIASIEAEIFDELCTKIINGSDAIYTASQGVATIDVSASLAVVAKKRKLVRPIVDDSNQLAIAGGRHPVVEHFVGSEFIANSCAMSSDNNLWLITGPNMAGKSTFLRQNALIIIMAQMGSLVPAHSAHIGVVDKVFSRIGASDDIASGQSTFMVEMIETANILNNATSRSFLILDEVGRGTSTQDGLSIAWAILENIHNNIKARTLFATHYHELTTLENLLPSLKCYSMRVKEWDNKVVFMHEVIQGKADKSYGIHVAQLAGLPESVINRAANLLNEMTENSAKAPEVQVVNGAPIWLEEELKAVDLDSLTPKTAFDLIYDIKGRM